MHALSRGGEAPVSGFAHLIVMAVASSIAAAAWIALALAGVRMRDARSVLRGHHERLDGSGYPDGLIGGELDLETRILALADVYDALVSPRVHREAWPAHRALELLYGGAGEHFDARCVQALARLVNLAEGDDLPLAAQTLSARSASP